MYPSTGPGCTSYHSSVAFVSLIVHLLRPSGIPPPARRWGWSAGGGSWGPAISKPADAARSGSVRRVVRHACARSLRTPEGRRETPSIKPTPPDPDTTRQIRDTICRICVRVLAPARSPIEMGAQLVRRSNPAPPPVLSWDTAAERLVSPHVGYLHPLHRASHKQRAPHPPPVLSHSANLGEPRQGKPRQGKARQDEDCVPCQCCHTVTYTVIHMHSSESAVHACTP